MAGKVACVLLCMCAVIRTQVIPGKSRTSDGDYNSVNTDGSFDFGYKNEDVGSSYHLARGNANKVVGGRFGARDPATGTVKETVYTAGPRGFRAKGPNVHRKMDLDQRPRGPIGNKDDPYFDPNEDPSYDFKFNTRTYSKNENADARGDVKGHYSYVDDIGERHDVNYIAGRDTGFHVSSAHPDSPSVIGSLFHREPLRRGEAKQRGRTAIQRGLDGSYRFISAGPDQRRTESSDANGNVRGSYTFLDDKGVQRTVNYIAGPGIGYRIVKNSKDPYIPAYFPTIPTIYDPDFVNVASPSYSPDDVVADDVFKGPAGTAASGHVKPAPFPSSDKDRPGKKPGAGSASSEDDGSEGGYSPTPGYGSSTSGGYGSGKPSSFGGAASDDDNFSPDEDTSSYGGTDFDAKPTKPSGSRPNRPYRPWRPTTKPGKPTAKPGRPTAKPGYSYGPTKKPYVPLKPFQKPSESVGGDYDTSDDDSKGPEYAVGFNIHSKPGDTIIHKPDGTIIHKPGTTIIRNIGEDYFGIPPGVSVRAHVQSIDLYPYDSKPLTPAEALEKDKT